MAKAKEEGEKKEITLSRDQLMASLEMERSKYEAIARRAAMLQNAQLEISAAVAALDDISKAGKGAKIAVPLGGGVMLEAVVQNTNEVMFSLAGGAVEIKDILETKKELEQRLEVLGKESSKVAQEAEKITKGLNNIRNIMMLAERNVRKQTSAKGQ